MYFHVAIDRMSPTGPLASAQADVGEDAVQFLLEQVQAARFPGTEELEQALWWALHAEAESVPGRVYGPEGRPS